MLPVFDFPIHGTVSLLSSDASSPSADALLSATEVAIESNHLGALVALYRRNEFLSDELKTIKAKLIRAQDYFASPACNLSFAIANFRHLRAKHAAILTMLRAGRREAVTLLRGVRPDATEHSDRTLIPKTGT